MKGGSYNKENFETTLLFALATPIRDQNRVVYGALGQLVDQISLKNSRR